MKITYDPAKRDATLANRGLDFADAWKVFEGDYAEVEDDRQDYGEKRYIAAGYLAGRIVVVTWTPRGDTRRVISMRYAHEREAKVWRRRMG